MAEEKRGKLGLILAMLFSLFFLSIIGLYGVYWSALNKENIGQARDSNEDIIDSTRDVLADTGLYVEENTESGVKRLRSLLLSRLPSRTEPERFTRVFNRLERAEDENRIDRDRFELFPEILKMALSDGEIDYEELELLLDNLELSIISEREGK